jgi:hypothetical protein
MKSKILVTSAAALLAGSMLAFGQGATERKDQAQPGTSQPGVTQGQPGQSKSKGVEGAKKEQSKPATSGQAPDIREQGPNRAQGPTQQNQDQNRAQGQNQRDQGQPRTQGQTQREQSQPQGQTRTPGQNQGQTQPQQIQPGRNQPGQAQGQSQSGGGTSVTLTTEQRTKVRQTVLEGRSAPRVDKVDFSLNVGTVVPRRVHVVEVPETIVEIHPEWRRYLYFVYNDEIIIVEPRTLKIVAVLDV